MSRRSRTREAGQATLDWVAMVAVAALVVVAVIATLQHVHLERTATAAVCRVTSALGTGPDGCAGAGGSGSTQTGDPHDDPYDDPWYCDVFDIGCYSPSTQGGDPQPEDAPEPWVCTTFGIACHPVADKDAVSIPDGLDRRSDLVTTLLSTQRGRDTLQWLADHHIPVVLDPKAKGAYWDGTQMVVGPGYDDPSVIVHETNHAMATVDGTSANAQTQNRQDYVTTAINEEVAGTVMQIQAAKEFRAAGTDVPEQPQERTFDQAYGIGKDAGLSDAEALALATRAVGDQFFSGKVRTSTDNKPYTDFYGDYWDSVH